MDPRGHTRARPSVTEALGELAGREGQNPDHERPHLTLHWGAGAAGPGWPSWGPLTDVPASRMVVPALGWAGLVHAFSVALFLGLFFLSFLQKFALSSK